MRKLSFLFAVLLCSWSMLMATNVKVRVLIPTDSEFTTTGDIVFAWKSTGGGAATSIVLTRESTTRWWGATVIIPDETEFTYGVYTETSTTSKDVAQVGGWSPSSYVAKDKPELNIEISVLVDDSDPSERVFLVEEVAATAPDHDYRISDLEVQDIGNGVTITWTANNMAPNYYIELMDDASTWDFADYVTVTEGKFTYYYDGTDDIHLGKLVFFPCYFDGVSDFHPYVRMFQKDLDINFANPENIIKKSLKAVQKDNTIEVSWDHYPAVTLYYVAVVYDSWGKEQVILPKFVPAKDGKYTLTIDELPANGDYDVLFFAQNANGDPLADITTGVTVTGLPTLGEVDLRVLIPSDNDMDISLGVWFEWMDVETKTATIVKADQDADGVWFSKKITTDKSAVQFRVCNKSNASGSNSSFSPIISTNQACFEMQYQDSHAWELREAACDAQDHDYRMTNVQVSVSDPVSMFTITITAKDYAPVYKFDACKSGDTYEMLAMLKYEGSNTFTCPVPFPDCGDYDYRITPQNDDKDQLAAEKTGTIHLKSGNADVPLDLAVEVGTDKQTVTFSWEQALPTTVDHYALEVDDDGNIYKVENIYEKSYSMKFYITRNHRVKWKVYAYNAAGALVAQASHGDMVPIVSPDYSPKDLKVAVDGNKATMTWTTTVNVQFCSLYVFDDMTDEFFVDKVVSGENGQFSATYTLKEDKTLLLHWAVQAESQDGVAMSDAVDGELFMLVGKAPTPRVPQTKEMTPTIGHLYWDETGGTWSATVYEYNASQEPVMVFILTVSGNKSTIPTTITLTNNTDDDNVFSEIVESGEPQFGDMIKNANLTVTYDGGIRTKDDGSGGITIYVLAKVSGEMNSDFGDKLIVNQSANFVEFYVTGIEPPTSIDQINQQSQITNQKFIKNGQLLILRDGKIFNAVGQEVK